MCVKSLVAICTTLKKRNLRIWPVKQVKFDKTLKMQLLTFHKLSNCNLISCPVNHELSLGFALVIPIGRFCKPNERTWLCHFLSSACSCDRWLWPILSLSQAGSARWCFVVPYLNTDGNAWWTLLHLYG